MSLNSNDELPHTEQNLFAKKSKVKLLANVSIIQQNDTKLSVREKE